MNYALIASVAAFSIVWRIFNAETFLAPGLELVTVLAVLSALLLPRVWAIIVPLVTLAIGDTILGTIGANVVWTWSAWAIIAALAYVLRRFETTRSRVLAGVGAGAIGPTIFFLISNFGVWVQGLSGGWSAPGFEGLVATYVMGLPFYLTPLAFNLVAVPVFALAALWMNEGARAEDSVAEDLRSLRPRA